MGVSLRLQEPPHHPGELVYSSKQNQEGEDLLKADVPVASEDSVCSVLSEGANSWRPNCSSEKQRADPEPAGVHFFS